MNLKRSWIFVVLTAAVLALLGAGSASADNEFCSGTLGDIQVDNLVVPEGASCTLSNTIVSGNISVREDGALHAHNVQVDGNIQANGAAQLTLDQGSFVEGNISIRGSGAAEIQSAVIDGNLSLDDNRLFLNISGNTINGNMQANENSGGLSISANTIAGNLQCRRNDPPPTGSENRVEGNLQDQCAQLSVNPAPRTTALPATPTQPSPTPTPTQTVSPPTSTPEPPTATPSTPTQSAPVANDDLYTLTGTQIQVSPPGILENDTYPTHEPPEIVLVLPPEHGEVHLGVQGDFEYQARDGFFGEDAFEYRLRSAGMESNSALVRVEIVDQEAPFVQWIAPVPTGERYDILDGETVTLEVQASDNGSLSHVTFTRWDALNLQYVSLGSVVQPPFVIQVNAAELNPGWNQIFVSAQDQAGNSSDTPYIWLFKVSAGQGGGGLQLYLPSINK